MRVNNALLIRLKQELKDVEELVNEHAIIFTQWRTTNFLQIMLHNYLIINLQFNKYGDIHSISYDKYLVTRISERATSVWFSSNYLVISSLEPRLSVYTFTKPLQFTARTSIQCGEPKLNIVDLVGPQGRRLEREVVVRESDGVMLVWWTLGDQQVYPWSPQLRVI